MIRYYWVCPILENQWRNNVVNTAAAGNITHAFCACTFNHIFSSMDRMRALESFGRVLSLSPNSDILMALNGLLTPRMTKLKEIGENPSAASKMRKEGVIFELDVLSTLLGSVENPNNVDCKSRLSCFRL